MLQYTQFAAPEGYACTAPASSVQVVECSATEHDTIFPGDSRSFTFVLTWPDLSRNGQEAGGSQLSLSWGTYVPDLRPSPFALRNVAVVDPAGAIVERDATNNTSTATVSMIGPALALRHECTPPLKPPAPDSQFGSLPRGTVWTCALRMINGSDFATAAATIPSGTSLLGDSLYGMDVQQYTAGPGLSCSPPQPAPGPSLRVSCKTTAPLTLAVGEEVVLARFVVTLTGTTVSSGGGDRLFFLSFADIYPGIWYFWFNKNPNNPGYPDFEQYRSQAGGFADF
jgi:hypothetical protein